MNFHKFLSDEQTCKKGCTKVELQDLAVCIGVNGYNFERPTVNIDLDLQCPK